MTFQPNDFKVTLAKNRPFLQLSGQVKSIATFEHQLWHLQIVPPILK
jgi:hypothetical protein